VGTKITGRRREVKETLALSALAWGQKVLGMEDPDHLIQAFPIHRVAGVPIADNEIDDLGQRCFDVDGLDLGAGTMTSSAVVWSKVRMRRIISQIER
jgi:hypothetical protein